MATPIFLGHWLWALFLARRDPSERNAFLYRLYLYATLSMFVGALAVAVFRPVEVLARFVFLRATTELPAVTQTFGASLVTLVVLGALWFYHYRLAARRDLAHTDATRAIYHLYTLGWAGAGVTVAAIGAYLLQTGVMDLLGRNFFTQLPTGLGLLAAGLPLWLYHEWHRRATKTQAAPVGDGLRWLYASIVSAGGILTFMLSLAGVFTWAAERVFNLLPPQPPYQLAGVTVGLAVWAYHEWALRRLAAPGLRPFRWLYALLFSAVGLLSAASGGVALLQWLFGGLRRAPSLYADGAAGLLPGLIVWAYHQWLLWQTSRALDLETAAEGPFRSEGRWLRRLYLFTFSGAGVALTTLGLIGVQEALYTGLRGQVALPDALAGLIVGLPLWLYHWLWAGRLFAAGLPDERKSDLRKIYLYLIIFVAVNTVITTAALNAQWRFPGCVGSAHQGQLGSSIAIILASVALWAYHAWVLRGDIAKAGESALQGTLQRLYWYLVATFGLAAFLVGLAGVLSDAISFVAAGLRADEFLRGQFATNLAALVAGLPVWLLAWLPAQAATRPTGPAGTAARRSWLRRLYLYGFALAAIIVTLVSAIGVVYQILNGLFRLGDGENVLANLARSAGFAVIGTAVWVYHVWVLRQDGKLAPADRAVEADQRAAAQAAAAATRAANSRRWAGLPVAIVDDGDGRFARLGRGRPAPRPARADAHAHRPVARRHQRHLRRPVGDAGPARRARGVCCARAHAAAARTVGPGPPDRRAVDRRSPRAGRLQRAACKHHCAAARPRPVLGGREPGVCRRAAQRPRPAVGPHGRGRAKPPDRQIDTPLPVNRKRPAAPSPAAPPPASAAPLNGDPAATRDPAVTRPEPLPVLPASPATQPEPPPPSRAADAGRAGAALRRRGQLTKMRFQTTT